MTKKSYIEGGETLALKVRPKTQALNAVKSIAKGVRPPEVEANPNKKKQRGTTALPSDGNVIEASETGGSDRRKAREFETITISGSKGQSYKVVVPATYVRAIPKVWEWTPERYRVAELVAEGIPLAQIPSYPEVTIKSRMTIYGWLEHPEFKEHVDALILETGWANRRERISKLSRLNEILLNKVVNELDKVKMTDKMAGALLSAIQAGAKLLAQEKGEFVEESKVTQDTNITGTVKTITAKLEDYVASKTADERKELEKEFDQAGDDIIRAISGDK